SVKYNSQLSETDGKQHLRIDTDIKALHFLFTIFFQGAGRVAHAAELHYMWDDGSNSDLSKFPEEDRLTLHRFVKLWTNFVKYQNPTPSHDPLLNGFIWPTTDSENLRYFNFNDTLEVKENPRQFKEVRSVLDRYLEPPYIYY
ncbi:uncharacterized protein, partial [Leptinotarsa decemlineata]|uniref:uncharacterized protein n=1 Tax=Leptinotarsa decemlineata TaxID=7539 RepID=UPI003D30879A